MNGGGGGVGTFAIQIAKAWGLEVLGVDGPGKQDAMREAGADRVMDFTHRGLHSERGAVRPHPRRGVPSVGPRLSARPSVWRRLRCGRGSTGRLIEAGALGQALRPLVGGAVSLVVSRANRQKDSRTLSGCWRKAPSKPVMDRVFPLSDGAEAMRHYVSGDFTGKVVITM